MRPMTRKLWMPFNVPNVGNCFVFNHLNNIAKDSSAGRRQSAFPGPFTGLKIVLDLEIDEYIKGALTESSGAVSLIQHPQDVLLPNEKGIALMPNTRTVIGMETNQLSRMGFPYPSDCVAHWNETAYPYRHQTLNYTQLECLRICFQEILMDTCDCYHPAFLSHTTSYGEEDLCELWVMDQNEGQETYECVMEIMNRFDDGDIVCGTCKPACHEYTYKISYSSSTWPSPHYWPQAFADFKGHLPMVSSFEDSC